MADISGTHPAGAARSAATGRIVGGPGKFGPVLACHVTLGGRSDE